jgi:transcriptional antiterminator Rof (Rho-off)
MGKIISTSCLPVLLLAVTLSMSAAAAPAPAARQEIEHLLNYVLVSGCQFYRNGSWYEARSGEAHLRTKYEYLSIRGEIAIAEDFIDKAASKSSLSGLAYEVKCGSGGPVASAQWLKEELARFRTNP